MAGEHATIIPQLLAENEEPLLRDWIGSQKKSGALRAGQISEAELTEASRRLIAALRGGAASGQFVDITAPGWDQSRTVLEDVSRSHATLGLTPSETATFVFSLKEPLFALLREKVGKDPDRVADESGLRQCSSTSSGSTPSRPFRRPARTLSDVSSRSCSSCPPLSCDCGRAFLLCR